MTITIDTSIFVELVLDQEKAEECESLLDAVAQGQIEANVSHFALHAIEAMFRSQQKLSSFLRGISSSKGLTVYDTTLSDEISIAILSERMTLDFDDSMQFYVAKRMGSSTIVSFDKHFDRLDIPRKEPSQVLKEIQRASKN